MSKKFIEWMQEPRFSGVDILVGSTMYFVAHLLGWV